MAGRGFIQQNREAATRGARARVNVTDFWLPSVRQLAAWIAWLSTQSLQGWTSSWIPEALASDTRSFSAWLASAGETGDESLLVALNVDMKSGAPHSVHPDVAYLIGWASATAYFGRLGESRAFTRPYELVSAIDEYGVGHAGVGDALEAAPDETWVAVKKEIEGSLKSIMAGTGEGEIPFPPLEAAKQVWSEAQDADQSLARAILEMPSDSVLHRVLADAGRREIAFYARALEETAGPWVTWPSLMNARHEIEYLVELLGYLPRCYDESGRWTRGWAARMVIHLIEKNLLLKWHDAGDEQGGEGSETEKNLFSSLMRTLHARTDGRFLIVRWLAHLILEVASAETSPWEERRKKTQTTFYYALVNAVVDSCAGAEWSVPSVVKAMFSPSEQSATSPTDGLPVWVDERGRRDHTIPLATTVALRLSQASDKNAYPELTEWFMDVVTSFPSGPSAHIVSHEQANLLTRLLGWPLCVSENSAIALGDAWKRLALTRVEASYSDAIDAMSAVDHCAAFANVALEAMSWGTRNGEEDLSELRYPEVVADLIDELRYFVPSVGLKSWSTTVSRFVSVMAATRWFDEPVALAKMLARYVGDNDTLAIASASVIANGLPATTVGSVLRSLGVEPSVMLNDYREWISGPRSQAEGNQVIRILQEAFRAPS
jgi:hypothetical protein